MYICYNGVIIYFTYLYTGSHGIAGLKYLDNR